MNWKISKIVVMSHNNELQPIFDSRNYFLTNKYIKKKLKSLAFHLTHTHISLWIKTMKFNK
jgi:hypothetical protein